MTKFQDRDAIHVKRQFDIDIIVLGVRWNNIAEHVFASSDRRGESNLDPRRANIRRNWLNL